MAETCVIGGTCFKMMNTLSKNCQGKSKVSKNVVTLTFAWEAKEIFLGVKSQLMHPIEK